jgi:energy-coupling factor transporter ATP-binding protein EcfA2
MGFVVCTESRHGELAVAYRFDWDCDVIEFFDQPEAIKLVYAARSGRMTGGMHTPDFLILRRELVSWIEVKTETRLIYLAEAQPNRFQRSELGQWRCVPGEETAKTYGFSYEIISTAQINSVLTRNLEYLDDFYRDPDPKIPSEDRKKLTGLIRECPGITIECLRKQLGVEVMDPLFALIVAQEIHVDLASQLISEQETARLFESEEVAKAWRIVSNGVSGTSNSKFSQTNGHELKNGPVAGTLALHSNTPAEDEATKPSPASIGNEQKGNGSPDALVLLQRASSKDIAIANERYAFLNDPDLAKQRGVSDRNLRRLRMRFRQSEQLYGQGYVGLLPRYNQQGNHEPRPAEDFKKFKGKIIGHPLLKRAFGRIMELIEEPGDVEVVAVIGPTGVGKSTLLRRVKQAIWEQNAAAMQADPGLIPVIAVNANAPETGSFSWRQMHLDILVELKEPACDWQVALKDRHHGKPGVVRLSSLTHIELKARVDSGFRHRSVKVLLVDEAQLLGKMASGRRLLDQTDTVRALAKSTGAFIVLLGTYDLIPLLGLNGQMARRIASVHLPRYRCDEPTEWRDFQTAIRSFESEMQLPIAPDLVRSSQMLYRGSVGCVGILKSWLTGAYRKVLRSGGSALTKEVLQSTCLPTSSLRKITQEIVEGERHWARSHAEARELDGLLGLSCLGPAEAKQVEPQPATQRSVPVGVRNPTRDPIGLEVADA